MKVMDPILIPMEEKNIWLKENWKCLLSQKRKKKTQPKIPGQNKTKPMIHHISMV